MSDSSKDRGRQEHPKQILLQCPQGKADRERGDVRVKIKTREALKTIKTFDRADSLAQKSKNGVSSLHNSAEQTQGVGYESETDFAGSELQDKEERVARTAVAGAGRVGRWGVRKTRKNVDKWRNRPKKPKQSPKLKQLPPPQRQALPPVKKGTKTTTKATVKGTKSTAKASTKAAQTLKKASTATVKCVQAIVKAVVAATKATVAAVKGVVAAIVARRKDAFAKIAKLDSEDPGCYAANL